MISGSDRSAAKINRLVLRNHGGATLAAAASPKPSDRTAPKTVAKNASKYRFDGVPEHIGDRAPVGREQVKLIANRVEPATQPSPKM